MKKLTIWLVIVFFFSTLLVKAPNSFALSNVWVEVSNRNPGAIPSFTFHLVPGKTLKVHDWIKFTFPKESVIKEVRKEDLKDPTLPPHLGLPIVDYDENSIKFNVYKEYHPGFDLVFTIPVNQVIQISNPPNPGLYYFKVSTQAEPTAIKSLPLEILVTKIISPVLDIEAPLSNVIAGYGLDFTTSAYGSLTAEPKEETSYSHIMNPKDFIDDSDEIKVTFPEGFIFTKNQEMLSPKWFTINQCFLQTPPKIVGRTLVIKVPISIGKLQDIALRIDCRVGIKTPTSPGYYELSVSTTTDSPWVLTQPFFLK